MREPESYVSSMTYIIWAKENKKRADRLAEAVMAYRINQDEETYNEMVRAQIDYEDQIG